MSATRLLTQSTALVWVPNILGGRMECCSSLWVSLALKMDSIIFREQGSNWAILIDFFFGDRDNSHLSPFERSNGVKP